MVAAREGDQEQFLGPTVADERDPPQQFAHCSSTALRKKGSQR
ncbi:hypothetical protein Poly41_18810 [Novipirellula artificiosorum]|uniref:Uncharacterized protein n=1 Tax=Novipirellula artificiosorum TaxID=2528016 RepID=A0A5C6DXS8_9BACT|nr:hypothetical protein Poly41_18810 [Novipirellula artificiosorum]